MAKDRRMWQRIEGGGKGWRKDGKGMNVLLPFANFMTNEIQGGCPRPYQGFRQLQRGIRSREAKGCKVWVLSYSFGTKNIGFGVGVKELQAFEVKVYFETHCHSFEHTRSFMRALGDREERLKRCFQGLHLLRKNRYIWSFDEGDIWS